MSETGKIIEQLRSEGYDKAYVWEAEPNEEDPDHSHEFETLIYVVKGDILIKFNGNEQILNPGDRVTIPKDATHYAITGSAGCTYIVAEKHN